jgi:hypothetical protein
VPEGLSEPQRSDAFAIPDVAADTGAPPPCGHYPPKIAVVSPPPAAAAAPSAAAAPAAAPRLQLPAPAAAPPAARVAVNPALEQELRTMLVAWAESWASGDFERYLRFYAEDFDPPGDLTVEEWEVARRGRLAKHPATTVYPDTLTVEEATPERIVAEFVQRSELDGVVSSLRKGLVLVREGDAWRIQKELVVEVLSEPR